MSGKKKIIACTSLFPSCVEYLSDKVEIEWHINEQPRDIVEQLKTADGVILGLQILDGDTIRKCPNLKVIAKQGIGFDNVDSKTATELGIPIVIATGANALSVAEHTMACILACAKNLRRELELSLAGDFSYRNKCEAFELAGKTFGLIGAGNIGMMVANMCKAFSMDVLAYDPFLSQEAIEKKGCRYTSTLQELLANSDVISIHVPLNESTKDLISYDEFALMKPTACLVNCSRGKIVNEKALYDALSNRKIFCAGIDTLEKEPTPSDDPLMSLQNFFTTPHVAGLTQESGQRVGHMVGEGIWAVLNNIKHIHVGVPAVYEHPRWKE